jgi:ABC-2 type transport system ATP-binding protein
MSQTAVVEFEEISKIYPTGLFGLGRRAALAGVSFTIEPGEVFALVGPNRAGKTTLVKILRSLCRPTAGRACRFQLPASRRETLTHVGYVHENPAFPRHLSALELLQFYGALALLPEPIVVERSRELLDRVGLADRAAEPIARFSKGMVQRLALAQALLNDPELLVLDEPNEGLDLLGRRLVRDVITERRRSGHAVLLVTHLLGEVEQLCDRLAVLVAGRLGYVGSVAGLLQNEPVGATLEQALEPIYQGLDL